ncbi:MAG TPA: ABC transporter ATP-binding protein [Candidatus Fournierella merdavium]|nr:ABC transporter ATP-binding protein [Candidatus Fournierella merdavium]
MQQIRAEDNSKLAVKVANLSKAYQVIHSPWGRFKYYVFGRECGEKFYALRDVNFTVNKGETFGIIGTNGSGKSTLLQIISGIIPATDGQVQVSGKVSALLELGSGFNPESTGYENIFLNAAILGVAKSEIEKKCQDIIAFADIGDFIHEPVKTYSSGMFIRLAFAVAINVEADVIIIDEALAVGDIFFRQKCYAKLNELKKQGKTIILVSHGMNEVEQFCDRALLLSHGKQIMLGDSNNVVQEYYMLNQEENESTPHEEEDFPSEEPAVEVTYDASFFQEHWRPLDATFFDLSKSMEHSNGMAHYTKVGLFDERGFAKRLFKQGENAYFYVELQADKDIPAVPINGVVLVNQRSIIVHGKNTFQTDCKLPRMVKKGQIIKNCYKIKLDLEEGEYTFEVGFSCLPEKAYSNREKIPHEELNEQLLTIASRRAVGAFAIQGKEKPSPSALKFYGLVDLPDECETKQE